MLDGRIDMVLDAGPTSGGLESTVVDLSHSRPRLLRPGLIPAAQISDVLGVALEGVDEFADEISPSALPSPGLMKKHYAPLVPVDLADDDGLTLIKRYFAEQRVGWLPLTTNSARTPPDANVELIELPAEPAGYAERLYDALHELERRGVRRIVVERPPRDAAWAAIHDRLQRAAASDE
ncbi:MAG: Sua5 family C-terminal domain-containing protein [Pirellulales bacterium]